MGSRTINTILTMRDNMSAPLRNSTEEMKRLRRQAQESMNQINRFGSSANKAFLGAAKAVASLAAGTVALTTGLAAKTALSEAMDLEGYRMQLETATKDTKKAADIMRYSVDLANKTPYEGGELVQGAAKFEAMGLSAKKYLPLIGDMAAATNKDFDQAVEAMIDAQAGELERLKEFGIKKSMIQSQADKMFGKDKTINNKGQIVDQEKFNKALEVIMIDKFKGGMDKQATTLKGTWSTITGITKSALATMFGMTSDGTIRTGSMFDNLKKKVGEVAKMFEKWQSDGTFTRLGATIQNVVDTSFRVFGGTVKFVKDNFDWLAPVMAGTLAAFTAFNVITKVVAMWRALRTALLITEAAQAGLNATMALNPLGATVLIIGGLIALLVIVIRHWATIKKAIDDASAATRKFLGLKEGDTNGGRKTSNGLIIHDKFAKGGYATRPSLCGEGADNEWVIPDNGSSRSKRLLAQANASVGGGGGGVTVNVAKLVVREEADVDKVAHALARKLNRAAFNT